MIFSFGVVEILFVCVSKSKWVVDNKKYRIVVDVVVVVVWVVYFLGLKFGNFFEV